MIVLALLVAIAVGVAIRLALAAARRFKLKRELRGDWWPRFEREFRAYAETFRTARDSEWQG